MDTDSTIEKQTVLIVDDSPDDIALINELLKDLYKIKIAGNGERALKVARTHPPPDLILLDIMMPVMDGYEICRRLKENTETLNIPVIFLTSKTELEDEMKGFALGAVDYITKPVSPPILLARVQTHLNLKQVQDYLTDKNAFLEDEVARRTQAITRVKREWERTFDTVPDFIALIDKDHRILRANRAMGEHLGKTCQELEGHHCYEVVHGLSSPPDFCPHSKLLVSRRENWAEFEEESLGLFLNVRTSPYYDETGQLLGSVHVVRDITERKKSEAALLESEEKFRLSFMTALDAFYWATLEEGRIIDINPVFEDVFGYTRGEVIGKTSLELGLYDVPADRARMVSELKGKGFVKDWELKGRKKDGKIIIISISISTMQLKNQRFILGTIRDITERKQAEQQLRERMKELQAFFTLSKLISRESITQDELFQEFCNFLPSSWQYPEITCVRIVTGDREYCTNNFRESAWRQSAPIKRSGNVYGHIDVCYLEERPDIDEGPFMKEERLLIDSLSERLGRLVERNLMEEDLKKSFNQLQKALIGTVQAMATVVESRDPYTAGHQRQVARIAYAIAFEMKLPIHQVKAIQMAAIIHDLGKIAVPAEILTKPTKLKEAELKIIQEHPLSGYEIIKDIEFPWPIARIVLEHHEKIDGTGYPNGLVGVDILLESRIITVADVIEAMASHRPYRPSLGIDAALKEIERGKGTQYDKAAVEACLSLFGKKAFKLEEA